MKALNLKKLGLWLIVLLLALSATSFGVMYYQVNKAWGEYVPVVDPALYAKLRTLTPLPTQTCCQIMDSTCCLIRRY